MKSKYAKQKIRRNQAPGSVSARKKTAPGRRGAVAAVCLLFTLLSSLLLCGYGSYRPGDPRVFDDADLLTADEEEQLQQDIAARIEKLSLDIIVVTTDDACGKSAGEYADDYYDANGFGYGDSYGPGILFLIDMDNREIYLSTAGEAIADFTDWEIRQMRDEIYYWMPEGDYYDACREFLDQVDEYAVNEETAQNGYFDKNTNTFVEYTEKELRAMQRKAAVARLLSPGSMLVKLGIAMVIGAVFVLLMCIHVNRNQVPGGRIYMKPGGEYIRQRYDHKTNTTVTKRHIPRSNNTGGTRSGSSGRGVSSSHRSSGGRSHGGGGRKF